MRTNSVSSDDMSSNNNKRPHPGYYAEDSYSDDDSEYEFQHEPDPVVEVIPKYHKSGPGRPRKTSTTIMQNQPSATITTTDMDTAITMPTQPQRKRGRGPSKKPCLNRNALMARENRQRKKEYVQRIERRLQHFQQENQELSSTIKKQTDEIRRLKEEANYLKNVLNNNTMVTTLLKSMNASLEKMHGNNSNKTNDEDVKMRDVNNDVIVNVDQTYDNSVKPSADVLNWIVSNGQQNSSKTNNLPMQISGATNKTNVETFTDGSNKFNFGQMINPGKSIARKTMPFSNGVLPKSEEPLSIENILEEDNKNVLIQKCSPKSGSFCEYYTDKGSAELDNRLPTTQKSAQSNSFDKCDASLSDTDYSELSSFNVDLFDDIDKLDEPNNPLQFEEDTADIFNEDTLFHTLDNNASIINNNNNNNAVDPLKISKMSNAFNEKSLFNNPDNTGVCLHISSTRISLEYCSICHMNSSKSQMV